MKLWPALRLAGWILAGGVGLAAPGFAQTPEADVIIREAYQEVLRRAPQDSEMGTYRARILDAGWKRADVVQALRRADEFIVPGLGRVFRELLGREPNQDEIELYHQRMKERGWTHDDVRRNIRRSDEYRQRKR